MRRLEARFLRRGLGRGWLLAVILVPALTSGEASGQVWGGYGSDPQHTCQSRVATQTPGKVLWHMPVDLNPPFSGNDLFIHYASPVITLKNTVVITVRSTDQNNNSVFQFTAVRGSTGAALWTNPLTTDYALPPHNWIPVCGPTLVKGGVQLAVPAAGGRVLLRAYPDRSAGIMSKVAFYGNSTFYDNNAAALNASIFICTPITADSQGNLYFGFAVPTPSGVAGVPALGGLARISSTGVGSFVTAAAATGDGSMQKVVYNCAPAISNDGTTVYAAVNDQVVGDGFHGSGYLVALDSTTLATKGKVLLNDPRGSRALLPDDGSATPTVGPDGDVYFGVLENPFTHNDRGWLLHFSGDLATTKIPGSFGWDDTASIVPKAAVPSYTGSSAYLVLTKYNNYAGQGGDGHNKLAILDPNDTQADPIIGTVNVMKEVLTVSGVTPDPDFGGTTVREWCVNSAAVDPINKCAVVNSEDGKMYRWDFTTNTLSAPITLAAATGEAYTPTVVGPDGAMYAINRAVLNCIVKKP